MELRVLRYFLAVCEAGTMSRAAENLHVTQPALSRQIAALERELGCELLVRHSRSVTPTEQGMYLRRRAQELVDLADQTTRDLSASGDIVEGDIRIGAGESEGMRVIARQIRSFRERYPQVRVHLHSAVATDLVERLEHGLDDFSVLMSFANIDRYAHLRLRPTDAWGLLMRADDPLASRETVGPADVCDEPVLMPARMWLDGAPSGVLATWLGDHASQLDVAGTYNLNYNAVTLVREGVGRMFSLEGLTPTGPETGLAFRLLYPPVVSVIDLAWKRGATLSHAARLFLEHLQNAEADR